MLIKEDSNFDKHVEVQHANKPYFIQLKRVYRMAKKIPNPDKSKRQYACELLDGAQMEIPSP